jgi:hypothetical protein
MPLPTLAIPGFDGSSHTVNTPNSGRQAAVDSAAAALSTEDKAVLDAISAKLAASIAVTQATQRHLEHRFDHHSPRARHGLERHWRGYSVRRLEHHEHQRDHLAADWRRNVRQSKHAEHKHRRDR